MSLAKDELVALKDKPNEVFVIVGICDCSHDNPEDGLYWSIYNRDKPHQAYCAPESILTRLSKPPGRIRKFVISVEKMNAMLDAGAVFESVELEQLHYYRSRGLRTEPFAVPTGNAIVTMWLPDLGGEYLTWHNP